MVAQSVQRLSHRLDDQVSIHGRGNDRILFFSPPRSDRRWAPPSLLSSGVDWGCFAGDKRPGRGADPTPPYSTEVKNAWSYMSTPPIRLHGVVNRRDNSFTFTSFLFLNQHGDETSSTLRKADRHYTCWRGPLGTVVSYF
jgi:hypothetical protein